MGVIVGVAVGPRTWYSPSPPVNDAGVGVTVGVTVGVFVGVLVGVVVGVAVGVWVGV